LLIVAQKRNKTGIGFSVFPETFPWQMSDVLQQDFYSLMLRSRRKKLRHSRAGGNP
jgi:hypothetical protein